MILHFFNFYSIQYPGKNNSYLEVIGGAFISLFKSISLGWPYNTNTIELVEVDLVEVAKKRKSLSVSISVYFWHATVIDEKYIDPVEETLPN